jgi:hypothetical protein
MSVEAITAAKYIDCKTPSVKLVLFVMANYADERGSCYPSEAHLGKICGISARQVRRCIKQLEEMEVVRVQHRTGTSNRYFLTLDTHVRGSPDTRATGGVDVGDRGVRTPTSAYTKEIQNNNHTKTRRSLNELAG